MIFIIIILVIIINIISVETIASNQYFNAIKLIQIGNVATDTALSVGAIYLYKLSTVPVDSYQGYCYYQ